MDNIINMFQNHISGLGSPPIFENKIDTNNIITNIKIFFFNICLKEKAFLINKKINYNKIKGPR